MISVTSPPPPLVLQGVAGCSVFWDTSKKREEQGEAVGRGSQVARVLSVTDQGVGGAAVPFTRWVDCLQISLARCSYQDAHGTGAAASNQYCYCPSFEYWAI